MKGTISFKKPIGYLSQVDYNYCEDKLKRDDRQILEELKDIPKEKYEQLQAFIEEREANCLGYINQAREARRQADFADNCLWAEKQGDRFIDVFHPFSMLYSDRLKKYREKENRGVLNAGDFGVLLLLMHCLEAHSNVLVNCKTGRRFTNRKDIADYVNMSRKNVSKSLTKLINAGLIYVPPGTKHFAIDESVIQCGHITEEGYRIRHGLSVGIDHKVSTENRDHEGMTIHEAEILRRQKLKWGIPPDNTKEYPIQPKTEYPKTNTPQETEGVKNIQTEDGVSDTELADDDCPF